MKKLVISLMVVLITITLCAQVKRDEGTFNDNTRNNKNYEAVAYRLFPTQDMWTFIKLNTRNGQMWQVQLDVNNNKPFEAILSFIPFANRDEETNGRFTLYSTQNIYTFILLDQFNGKARQVQWSTDAKKRLVLPIE